MANNISDELFDALLDKFGELIDKGDFTKVYNMILSSHSFDLTEEQIGEFTSLLYMADIKPLTNMKRVPAFFLYKGDYNGKVAIPNGVARIGVSAFEDSQVAEVDIPMSVIEIGDSAFEHCGAKIVYEGTEADWANIRFANESDRKLVKVTFKK